MAKPERASPAKANLPQTEETQANQILTHGDFKLPVANLAPSGVAYLLQHGFSKSLTDSVAGLRKELKDEGLPQADIDAKVLATMQERMDKIAKGEVGTRTNGPRLRGLDAMLRDVALEQAKTLGIKLPTKATESFVVKAKDGEKTFSSRDAFLTQFLGSKFGPAIKAEAQRRFDAQVATKEVELDL